MVRAFVTLINHRCVAFRSSANLCCGFSYVMSIHLNFVSSHLLPRKQKVQVSDTTMLKGVMLPAPKKKHNRP